MAEVKPGIYLEDNPPARRQFRARRANVKPVIVLHTTESALDRLGHDAGAENVANFIRTRSDPGSYHLLGDRDSVIQLVRLSNEAFHDGTGSNRWSIGISLAMRAEEWSSLSSSSLAQELIDVAAQMAVIAATWLKKQGVEAPLPQKLTKLESESAAASGFIAHGHRDPARRSDPGLDFPWGRFLHRYQELLGGDQVTPPARSETQVLQELVGVAGDGIVGPVTMSALNANWLGNRSGFDPSIGERLPNDPLVVEWAQRRLNDRGGFTLAVDGLFGPLSEAAAVNVLGHGGIVAAESFIALTGDS